MEPANSKIEMMFFTLFTSPWDKSHGGLRYRTLAVSGVDLSTPCPDGPKYERKVSSCPTLISFLSASRGQ